LEHFKKLEANLEFHHNKCHPEYVPNMRRPCAKAADQWDQGVASRPNPWPVGPNLWPLTGRLHGESIQEAVTGNPKPKVGGGQTPWPPGHVARPAGHHLVSYRLNQISYPSLEPSQYPLPVEINTPHSTYSSSLVKVLV
jgi:hypothetical protein